MGSSDESKIREFYAAVERDTLELKRRVMMMLPRMPERPEFAAWRAERRILAVSWQGEDVYPAFQFDEHVQPLPVIAAVLQIFQQDATRSDWRNLIWFACNNSWLGGPSPAELLSDPARVLRAAEIEVTPEMY